MVIFQYNLYIFGIHLWTVLYPKSYYNELRYTEVEVYKLIYRGNSFTVLLSENEGNAVAFVQYAFSHAKFCGQAECSVSKKCKENALKGYYITVWLCEEMTALQPSSKNLAGPCATMDSVRAVKAAKSVHSCKVVKPGERCEKLVSVEMNNDEAYAFRPPNHVEKE